MRLRQKNLSSVFSPGGKNCLYHKFKDDRKLEKVVIWWLKTCGMNLYQRGIERSVIRYEKCLIFSVDYVQMYWKNDVQLNFNRSDFFFFVVLRPNAGYGLLTRKVSRSHTTTHHSWWDSSERVISSSQKPLTTHNAHKGQTSMPRRDSNPQSQQASGRRPTP